MKRPVSQLPGTSRLVADYFDHFDRVAEFYSGDYRDPKNLLGRAGQIKSRDLPLGRLAPILKEQNQRFGCGSQTLAKIDWLLDRNACAVVTGQQTGLFAGPLFTIYKALTAIKFADRLSRNCEGCYVPMFWLASDDHDFREANHIVIPNRTNEPVEIAYEAHPTDSRIPVSEIRLTDAISQLLEQLDEHTHPSEFKADVLAQLADAYQPGTGFAAAFGSWLTTLFKPFGLILIDASDPRMKTLGRPVFEKEISGQSPSTTAALLASKTLGKEYHAQVQVHPNRLNLFYVDKGRHAIEFSDGSFSIKDSGRTFSEHELLTELEQHPERFSPNVLLRPLYQDALLPTIAYVAGPAESAYYAQMKGIYAHFEIPMPVIFPRKSLTLLENKIEKVLDTYNLKVPDFWGNVDSVISRIAQEQLPESLEQQVADAARKVNENLETLGKIVAQFEPTLISTVEKTRGKMSGQIDMLSKKIVQAYKKRNEVIGRQIYKAKNSLYPNNHLQERGLNIVPYLIKHGFGFIDQLHEAIDISHFDHQIIRI
ncbi:MAG: bacillithiol biosynthesis cysteine-adding enzyme BshC [bacterium]